MNKIILFVLVKIRIQCSEYQFNSKTIHEFTVMEKNSTDYSNDVKEFGEALAKNFYQHFSHEDAHGNIIDYYFNGGEVAVRLESAEIVTEVEYEVLKKLI